MIERKSSIVCMEPETFSTKISFIHKMWSKAPILNFLRLADEQDIF